MMVLSAYAGCGAVAQDKDKALLRCGNLCLRMRVVVHDATGPRYTSQISIAFFRDATLSFAAGMNSCAT